MLARRSAWSRPRPVSAQALAILLGQRGFGVHVEGALWGEALA
jgi:hypothetical protein